MTTSIWTPNYTLNPTIASGLMRIETARALVDYTPLTPAADADLTSWLEYFVSSLANSFEAALLGAVKHMGREASEKQLALRGFDYRARAVLGLFARKETITASEVAEELGLSERTARNLLKDWVEDGWLEVTNPSCLTKAYSLSEKYRQYIGSLSAMPRERERNER